MARLFDPVTRTICSMPAATASSTICWMTGLSTIGNISLGIALVNGKKRVPKPATGITALRILCGDTATELFAEEHGISEIFRGTIQRLYIPYSAAVTLIILVLAFSCLGIVTVRMPSLSEAWP